MTDSGNWLDAHSHFGKLIDTILISEFTRCNASNQRAVALHRESGHADVFFSNRSEPGSTEMQV